MDNLHTHSIETPDNQNFNPKEVRQWDFKGENYLHETFRLGESFFMGTLEEAEKEAHERAKRHEFAYEPVYQITLILLP